MTTDIFIENLVISGKHGVYPPERHTEQEFSLDIKLRADVERAATSGAIDDTVDYDRVLEVATEIIKGDHEHLIERLANRIAEKLLEHKRVREVSVTIRKPEVWQSGVPGATVTRTRSS